MKIDELCQSQVFKLWQVSQVFELYIYLFIKECLQAKLIRLHKIKL